MGGIENRGNGGKGERLRREKFEGGRENGRRARTNKGNGKKGEKEREETGNPALVFMSFMEKSGFPRERLVWFDFCFRALQHILGHFERSQFP